MVINVINKKHIRDVKDKDIKHTKNMHTIDFSFLYSKNKQFKV